VGRLLLVLVAAGACTLSTRALVWQLPTSGTLLDQVEAAGSLADAALSESSGLAPSTRAPAVFWTVNDGGHAPVLWAIDPSGATRARVRVTGAANVDWEAIASGPCPDGFCVYIGDVGDNLARRDAVVLWRIPEPALDDSASVMAEALAVRYPDGPRDVEALYLAPDSAVWLIAKRPPYRLLPIPRPARLYRVPATAWRRSSRSGVPTDTVVATAMGTIPITPGHLSVKEWITDASLSAPDARGVQQLAVLTYGAVHLFALDARSGRPGALLRRCALPIPEHDPEAVSWLPDGRLLLTNEGTHSIIYTGRCDRAARGP
jgi:hypothetical protein